MIGPMELLRQVSLLGGEVTLNNDSTGLHIKTTEPLTEELRQALREHKAAIMVALGTPLDVVIGSVLTEIRLYLPPALQRLSDDKLLALVNWSIIVAWQRAMRSVGADDSLPTL